jgi:curli biogenesis system outer membrane secretion channel CsgG
MRELLINWIPKILSIAFLFFLISCSAIDQIIHPNEKLPPPTWPTYEQILKENYKGPKARVVVTKFIDKSVRGKEMSQVGDGVTEMLRNALLATNRYIIQVRKSLDDVIRGQDIGDSSRSKKEEETDLLIEGVIREFKSGIAGAGDEKEETSYVTLIVKVTNPRTNKELASERIRGKAADIEGMTEKGVIRLAEIFKDFSKTPMEKAIRIAIEESASFIVAKTPPESYRVLLPPSQKETPKKSVSQPPPEPPKVMAPPPPSPPLPLRVTLVVWEYVNLREGPGTNYKVIGNVKKGVSLRILEVKGDWLRVRLKDGSEAWVSRLATSEASSSSPSPTPPKPSPM